MYISLIKSMQEYFFIKKRNTRNKRHSKVPLVDNFIKNKRKNIIHEDIVSQWFMWATSWPSRDSNYSSLSSSSVSDGDSSDDSNPSINKRDCTVSFVSVFNRLNRSYSVSRKYYLEFRMSYIRFKIINCDIFTRLLPKISFKFLVEFFTHSWSFSLLISFDI